ncbi:MAG: sugar ABC transporter substrate-binding protein [Eubacteriales bacterium]|nr:sugar ABC transporter substrate-binding protein [Eubacteriales bacterium]
MHRGWKSLISLAMASFLLAGCGSQTGQEQNNAAVSQTKNGEMEEKTAGQKDDGEGGTEAAQEQITLTFSYWGDKNELAVKKALIEDFEAAHPNIKIEATFTDGVSYHTKLQTFFSSNSAPDVVSIASDIMYDFAEEGMFEDLTPYMERDQVADQWMEGSMDPFTKGGKIYAAPYVSKVFAIAYNKNIFDEAGIAYPEDGWTEEEFVETAKALTSGEGVNKIYGTKLGDTNSIRDLYGVEALYDVTNKVMKAQGNESFEHAITLWTDLIRDGYSPSALEVDSIGGGFETGKFATSYCATWDMNSWESLIGDSFDWDVVTLPVNEEYGAWTYPAYIDGMAISATSEKKEAAWEFIKWNTLSEESERKVSQLGVPVLKEYVESEEYLNDYPDSYTVKYDKGIFVAMMARVAGQESLGVWAEINDELTKQYNAVSLGETTVEEAIAALQVKGDQVLQ